MMLTDLEFANLSGLIERHCGIHLESHKKVLMMSRLRTVLAERELDDFNAYYQLLQNSKDNALMMELVDRISTNHTFFNREEKHFDFLKHVILPELKATRSERDIRIWSAGCSTGEEPYTISMVLFDFLGIESTGWNTDILATDISIEALKQAQRAVFRPQQFEKMPKDWLRKYFRIHNEGYEAKDTLKGNVIFRRFNLMDPFSFKKKFDVIFCRNVMIYFTAEVRRALIMKYAEVLKPGGYLIVGHSETVDKTIQGLEYIQPSIYRRNSV